MVTGTQPCVAGFIPCIILLGHTFFYEMFLSYEQFSRALLVSQPPYGGLPMVIDLQIQ